MNFKMNVNMDNAAFADDYEIVSLLRRVARLVEAGKRGPETIQDTNGNTCGTWEIA